jgi:hypothetical protein
MGKYVCGFVKIGLKNLTHYDGMDIAYLDSYCKSYSLFGKTIDSTFILSDNCDCGWFSNMNFNKIVYVTKNNINSTIPFSFIPISRDTIFIELFY